MSCASSTSRPQPRSPTASTKDGADHDDPPPRLRRRHVRRVGARVRRRRLRGQVDCRRQPLLGGDNFDKATVDWIGRGVQGRPGRRLGADPMNAPASLRDGREGEDRAQLDDDDADQRCCSITATQEGPKHLDLPLTRAMLEELTHDLPQLELGNRRLTVAGGSRSPTRGSTLRRSTTMSPSAA